MHRGAKGKKKRNRSGLVELPYEEDVEYEKRRQMRRMRRKQELIRRRKREALMRGSLLAGTAILMVVLVILFLKKLPGKEAEEQEAQLTPGQKLLEGSALEEGTAGLTLGQKIRTELERQIPSAGWQDSGPEASGEEGAGGAGGIGSADGGEKVYRYAETENTLKLGEEIVSTYAVFVDTQEDTILASKEAFTRMVPASMTKVLTLLVAAERIENLDDTFTITQEIVDYSFRNDCSCAGFEKEEVVTIRDLLYGTVLPSGADAALGLAHYVSGSQEAFVELMNAKLTELGLSETSHFTNCVGIYDIDHYTTAYDMAVIMEAAIQNEICREVFSARTFETSLTSQHPEGMLLSNWFVRRIEDKDTGGMKVFGKTGFVDESGSCAASFGTDENGEIYICVTANAYSKWSCINDHAKLYQDFGKK